MTSEEFFGTILQQYNRQRPFAAFRKPHAEIIKVMLQNDDKLYKTSSYDTNGFVFAPFDDYQEAILFPDEKSEELVIADKIFNQTAVLSSDSESFLDSKKDHVNLVKKGIEAIKQGQFEKVVLSRKEVVNWAEANPIEIFKRLLNSFPTAFVYCWYHPKVGLWLGATPETLLKLKGNQFSTMALAGTQVYKGTLEVVWDAKELQEQQIVTEYIVGNLQKEINDLTCSKTTTLKAGKLLHLQTIINGTLNSNLKQVLQILHPTPAVCGVPKKEAKQFILENEKYNREFYTGFLGELSSDNSELYVNLRCMQLNEDKAIVYVGGGITKDSNPENEWEETFNKAKIMKTVL